MRILYVFPHPDDESFGPARGIAAQVRQGHQVSLLTLTRGGATRIRHEYGYSVEQMGDVRAAEMQEMASVLELHDLTILGFPDSGLKEMDPRVLETAIAAHIVRHRPEVLVTYPVHGISGFHDHLVTHAVVKRVYEGLHAQPGRLVKRLAFFTLTQEQAKRASGIHRLNGSTDAEIDCWMTVATADIARWHRALDCYRSYGEVIESTGIKTSLDETVCYEFYRETCQPPVASIDDGL